MENDGGAFSAKLVKENEGEWVSVMMILPKWSFENRGIARVCKLKAHWRQQRPKWFSEWDNWAVRACWRGYWANSRQFCVTYRDRWSFERVFFVASIICMCTLRLVFDSWFSKFVLVCVEESISHVNEIGQDGVGKCRRVMIWVSNR